MTGGTDPALCLVVDSVLELGSAFDGSSLLAVRLDAGSITAPVEAVNDRTG